MTKKATKKKALKKNMKALAQAVSLVEDIDWLGEKIKEYSYDSSEHIESENVTDLVSKYIEENTSFHGYVAEYNEKMNELCRLYSELPDAEKYA